VAIVATGLAGLAIAVAGCGSTPASSAGRPAAGITAPGLATSLASAGGTSWAVVQMGASAAQHNNFWELFVRPAGTAGWRLATPVGVASNGGIVAAITGSGSLMAGIRPSQDLTFTPLAQTTDAGVGWSQTNVLDAGIADVPGALAGGPAGQLLAVTQSGDVDTSSSSGASWSRLTTQHALAAAAAGRACALTAISAAAWSPGGAPMLAGDCGKHGVAGIFTRTAGAWRATAPSLPAALATGPVSVFGLNTTGTRTTALLAVGTGADTGVIAAWTTDGGSNWTLSGELHTGAAGHAVSTDPSVSFGPDGSAALVLPGKHAGSASQGAIIGWQAPGWQELPPLPAYTATVSATQSGAPEALSAHGATLTAWQLPATGSAGHWTPVQTVHITIPYGSSS
jgi:hypothetical protein